ncbi:MAG: phosphatase [Rhodobacteraceae bacterium]|nr:MAG: phosphatase [Paracoccaceae bacterium]
MQDTIQINDRFTVARFAPAPDDVRQASREGFRAIVNMQTAQECEKLEMTPQDEGRLARAEGLTYAHHPVEGAALSAEVVDSFRQKARALPAPVLVHCASGQRSGALVMMHIACETGMDGDEVLARAEDMGFSCGSDKLEAFVKDYVDRHSAG